MQMNLYSPDPVQGNGLRGPRVSFQWRCLLNVQGPVLDVGCCNDPNGFGHRVVHFDYDDWGQYYRLLGQAFIQGDAHHLTDYFPPESYELVIMGDILEHLPDPLQACREACKVTNKYLCMTIWEEWRGPGGDGQVAWSQQKYLEECADKDYATSLFGGEYCIPKDDMELSHWGHCQKFTDEDISLLVAQLCDEFHMSPRALYKALEVVHEGHECFNWLVLLEKVNEDSPGMA